MALDGISVHTFTLSEKKNGVGRNLSHVCMSTHYITKYFKNYANKFLGKVLGKW